MNASKKIFLGIDEAGRGSVIGPLVMGAVSIDHSTLLDYEKTSIADSKQLTPQQREELYEFIKQTSLSYSAIKLDPVDIDKSIRSSTSNLNLLELQTMTELIIKNPESTDIFIDAISKPDYCTTNLKTLLLSNPQIKNMKKLNSETLTFTRITHISGDKITLLAQNKADINFKVVSAASIVAKVTRDQSIRDLEKQYNLKEGILASGYPNDQLRPFLQQYKREIRKKEFPFIRYTWEWQPLKTILSTDNKRQAKLL